MKKRIHMILLVCSLHIQANLCSDTQSGTLGPLTSYMGKALWNFATQHPGDCIATVGLASWLGYEAIQQRSLTDGIKTIVKTTQKDLGIGVTVQRKLPHELSVKSHIGHAMRLFCYAHFLYRSCMQLNKLQSTDSIIEGNKNYIVGYMKLSNNCFMPFYDAVIKAPLIEEVVYTYLPVALSVWVDEMAQQSNDPFYRKVGIFSQCASAILFGLGHNKTHGNVAMFSLMAKQLLKLQAFKVQPGYLLSPLACHMANNFVARYQFNRLVAELLQTLQEQQKEARDKIIGRVLLPEKEARDKIIGRVLLPVKTVKDVVVLLQEKDKKV